MNTSANSFKCLKVKFQIQSRIRVIKKKLWWSINYSRSSSKSLEILIWSRTKVRGIKFLPQVIEVPLLDPLEAKTWEHHQTSIQKYKILFRIRVSHPCNRIKASLANTQLAPVLSADHLYNRAAKSFKTLAKWMTPDQPLKSWYRPLIISNRATPTSF